jgi:hypothetical protein
MATTRKRSSGFTEKPEELLEEVATEMFETISHEEEAVPVPVPVAKTFVVESITPTEDSGPRFIPEAEPTPVAKTPELPKPVAPKRHPRNIPKFSRHKEL